MVVRFGVEARGAAAAKSPCKALLAIHCAADALQCPVSLTRVVRPAAKYVDRGRRLERERRCEHVVLRQDNFSANAVLARLLAVEAGGARLAALRSRSDGRCAAELVVNAARGRH